MTAKWQAGHTYVPGDLVVPATAQTQNLAQPTNAGFETGDLTGWTASYGTWAVTTEHYAGTYGVQLTGGAGGLDMSTKADIRAGQVVTASAMAMLVNSGNDDGDAAIALLWFDDAGNSVGTAAIGNHIRGKGGFYAKTSVSAAAPDGATKVIIRLTGTSPSSGGHLHYDAVAWSANIPAIPAGLVYRATQAGPGKSGSVEPSWPATTGVPVTDNQVTWEGVIATRLVWKAEPLLKSGTTEPTWPTMDDGVVKDNIIDWKAITPRVTDALCPQSKIVTIAANKVFVGDGDVVRYCATNDATDWTSEQDAGYLPTGLQAVGETECTALGIYRGNLVAWTASSMEVWQVDPDPARMAIVDTVEGVGTTFVRAAIGMMNDLFFLSPLGVRSVSTSATTGTMGAADVGSPVDPLVRAAIDAAAAAGIAPVGVFYSNASQFWVFLGAEAYVYTISQATGIKAWSRYTFPWSVTHACVKDGELYVRTSGNDVYVLDESIRVDYTSATTAQAYEMSAWWPWNDMGSPGSEKMMIGTDVVYETNDVGVALSISGALPDGTRGDVVDYQYAISGQLSPITASIISGALPDGLTMSSSGHVTGTLVSYGNYSWTVQVEDAYGNTEILPDAAVVGQIKAAYFDGSGDYLTAPFAAPILGSGDFTVQARISPSVAGGNFAVVSGRNSNIRGWAGQVNSSGTFSWRQAINGFLIDNGANVSGGAISINRFTHVAITRKGTVFTVWLDGVAVATSTQTGAIDEAGVTKLAVGSSYAAISENIFKGYIDWLTVNIGECLYTANFTPPTNPDSVPSPEVKLAFNEPVGSTSFSDTGSLGLAWTTTGNVIIAEYPY